MNHSKRLSTPTGLTMQPKESLKHPATKYRLTLTIKLIKTVESSSAVRLYINTPEPTLWIKTRHFE